MKDYNLKFQKGYLFANIDGDDWLINTGAPRSSGKNQITLEDRVFPISGRYSTSELSEYLDHPTAGIIGADILNKFDILINMKSEKVSFSTEEITFDGEVIDIEFTEREQLPIVRVNIDGLDKRMFFNTGSNISYSLFLSGDPYHWIGTVNTFDPEVGPFEAQTCRVWATLGSVQYELCLGYIPTVPVWGWTHFHRRTTLPQQEADGLIGSEILDGRIVGYFPRRHKLVLA